MISYLSPSALQQILLKVSLSAGLIASCSSPTAAAAAAAKRDGICAESLRGGNKKEKKAGRSHLMAMEEDGEINFMPLLVSA